MITQVTYSKLLTYTYRPLTNSGGKETAPVKQQDKELPSAELGFSHEGWLAAPVVPNTTITSAFPPPRSTNSVQSPVKTLIPFGSTLPRIQKPPAIQLRFPFLSPREAQTPPPPGFITVPVSPDRLTFQYNPGCLLLLPLHQRWRFCLGASSQPVLLYRLLLKKISKARPQPVPLSHRIQWRLVGQQSLKSCKTKRRLRLFPKKRFPMQS